MIEEARRHSCCGDCGWLLNMKSQAKRFDIVFKNSAARDEAPVNPPVGYRVLLSDAVTRRRPVSGAAITVAMALIGLLAGWIAGIALTGGFHGSRTVPESPPDIALPSQAPADAQAAEKGSSVAARSLHPRDSNAEARPPQDQDNDATDPRATKQAVEERPEERETVVPSKEPSREIGQAAMDKILKENEKMKRGKRQKENKNDDEN